MMIRTLFVTCLVILLDGCYFSESTPPDQHIWEYASPSDVGMNQDGLIQLDMDMSSFSFGPIESLILIKNDKLVFENYYGEINRTSVSSISRLGYMITLAALGIAIEEGMISSIDDPIKDYLPQYTDIFEENPDKGNITFRNIMTMKSGLSWNEVLSPLDSPVNDFTQAQQADDWAVYVLSKPLTSIPGLRYSFNSLGPILITKAIERAAGMSYLEFIENHLFKPLGINDYAVQVTSDGHPNTIFGFSMPVIDITKFGYLFLKEGQINEEQIISSEWVNETIATQASINFQDDYGLLWWKFSPFNDQISFLFEENDIYYTLGVNGQVIYMIPHMDLIVSMTMNANVNAAPYIGFWVFVNQILPHVQ